MTTIIFGLAHSRVGRQDESHGGRTHYMIKSSPILLESEKGASAYTCLFARIIEEDGSFTVQVRLSNDATAGNAAWGEEVTDCFETASTMIATLAARFAIPAERIKIEIRMNNSKDGTRH